MTWFRIALWVGIPFWSVMMVAEASLTAWLNLTVGLTGNQRFTPSGNFSFASGLPGIVGVIQDKYNTQGRSAKFLSENAFTVYVFHAPILMAIFLMVQRIIIYPLLKMILMVFIALPICFGFGELIRKVPGFGRYIHNTFLRA
jgi:glucans biosynthesis protein C